MEKLTSKQKSDLVQDYRKVNGYEPSDEEIEQMALRLLYLLPQIYKLMTPEDYRKFSENS